MLSAQNLKIVNGAYVCTLENVCERRVWERRVCEVCVCVSRSAFDNNCLPLSFFLLFLPATPFFIALQTAAPL